MTLQNRVLPTGEIMNQPFRGTLMGNRGILHDDQQHLKTSRWTHPHWVTCVLKFKGRHRPLMTTHNYTELFFLDESTALAAGHRPCSECRRAEYQRWRRAWAAAHGTNDLKHDDRALHAARVHRNRSQRHHCAPMDTLPDGSFIHHQNALWLIWQGHILRQSGGRYTDISPRPPTGPATVLTPAPTVTTIAMGYQPIIHPSALALLSDH